MFLEVTIGKQKRGYLRPVIIQNRFSQLVFGVINWLVLLNGTIQKYIAYFHVNYGFVQTVVYSLIVDDFKGCANTFEEIY